MSMANKGSKTTVKYYDEKRNIPLFIPEAQDGYDPSSRRYRSSKGAIVKKSNFIAGGMQYQGEVDWGGNVNLGVTPYSDAMSSMENIIRGADTLQEMIASVSDGDIPEDAQPIPAPIRAQHQLAHYYVKTEGDVRQHIEAPIDVGMGELEINCPDKGVERELKELYSESNLGMWQVLNDCWYSAAIFGLALPLAVFDGEGNPNSIVLLPPKNVWIGNSIRPSYGEWDWKNSASPYALKPLGNSGRWTDQLVRDQIMPMTYNAFAPNWNEQVNQGRGISLSPEYLFPIRAKSLPYERYPTPPLAGAFRSLSIRAIFDECVRATIEGTKNQLWVFLLGNKDHPPSPAEMKALRNQVSGMAGARTGSLVWGYWLDVKQFSPKPLEELAGNEARQEYTVRVFRDIGGNIRIETGNQAGNSGGKGDSNSEIDLSVWLKRLDYPRNQLLRWEKWYRTLLATKRNEPAFTKAIEKTTVTFSKSLLEKSDIITKELQPMYTLGTLSTKTYLGKAGYNYDSELAQRKSEKGDDEFFQPRTAYVQGVQGKTGEVEKKTGQGQPQGRTPDAQNVKKMERPTENKPKIPLKSNVIQAADEDSDEMLKALVVAISLTFDEFLRSKDVDALITTMRSELASGLYSIAQREFAAFGGTGSPDGLGFASDYVTSFIDWLRNDLLDAVAQGKDLESYRSRVLSYPREGYKMAIGNGQRLAMLERGAIGWRRILHPERSMSGPCELCVADSMTVHAIAEPFVVMHPNEKCTKQEVFMQYYTDMGIPTMEFPMPRSR